ncbi:Serine/threonine-protein phosphatase 7 long form like [Arachis hypogaea]|nr:Serine/threonine-protein phosphatase 7 long form like [Arachis hypogaea]
MLICDHLNPPDLYNQIVESQLRETGFYYVFQIGVIKGQSAMINALIERWRPETHTFHFSVGECAVTLEDVALILGLPTNGLPVTGPTMSSFEALEAECLHQFEIAPRNTDCRGSFIKLKWFRGLKDRIVLNDDVHMQMYVKCHIMLLFGTILFADKSGAVGNSCRLQGDGRSTDTVGHLGLDPATISSADSRQSLSVSNCKQLTNGLSDDRWHNWDRQNYAYRYKTLAHYRRLLDDLQEGQAYGIGDIDPDVIPLAIHHNSVIWSATMPLISFECIEWHATDRVRRQFGLTQGVPNQEQDLKSRRSSTTTTTTGTETGTGTGTSTTTATGTATTGG